MRGQVTAQPRAAAVRAPTPVERAIDGVIGWARAVLGLFALGLVLVLLFPTFSRRTVTTLEGSPVASFVVGLIAFIVVPIAALLVFGVGLVVGGWWLGLMALALYGIALAVGVTVAALFVGTWLLDRAREAAIHPVWALLLGVAILVLAGLVPVVGGIVTFLALLFGGGSLLLTAYRSHEETPSAGTSSIAPGSGPPLTAAQCRAGFSDGPGLFQQIVHRHVSARVKHGRHLRRLGRARAKGLPGRDQCVERLSSVPPRPTIVLAGEVSS